MIFPLEVVVTVFLNGTIVRSYNPAVLRHGHVMAPVDPFVTSVAATIGYTRDWMVIVRADRFAEVPVPPAVQPSQLARAYVAVAPILRTLGASVAYDARRHALDVRFRSDPLVTPTPFNAAIPRVRPAELFTPVPSPTPRPVVTGKPVPRRTPLPAPESTPRSKESSSI